MKADSQQDSNAKFDYIIVGSGAGGGPLAARLVEQGARVLIVEAGRPPEAESRDAQETIQVPSLHGVTSEHPEVSWKFFVDHYDNPPTGEDPKRYEPSSTDPFPEQRRGIFYPRAAGLGGCTIHNAMITMAGPDSDWNRLAEFLDDDSWSGVRMRKYFQRIEYNEYLPLPDSEAERRLIRWWHCFRWLIGYPKDFERGRHGFNGWLHTSTTDLSLGLGDRQLKKMLKAALIHSHRKGLEGTWTWVSTLLRGRFRQALDPNHYSTMTSSPEGIALIPLAVQGKRTTIHHNRETPSLRRGRRSSPRDLLIETARRHSERLTIWYDCLVSKVLFADDDPQRVIGIEFQRGERLYRADPQASQAKPTTDRVYVERERGEVILCGGAFNTPQLLMLSGIGDRESLAKVKGIKPKIHSPGVGRNLQDRYEVTVISEMKNSFRLLDGARFRLPGEGEAPDQHLNEWRQAGTGLYTSNGAVLGIFKRSRPELTKPDLFIFGIPAPFKGYSVGYSDVGDQHQFFTWTILKAQTNNHDGTVSLRSSDPRDTPFINFHYFNELTLNEKSHLDPDLTALAEGVKFVRGIADEAKSVIKDEYHPGTTIAPKDNDELVKRWIQREAWGHHACGTCRMGRSDDPNAVIDSRFRVLGDANDKEHRKPICGLRIVDASIFPQIPGYFIVSDIYMASEKAADVILEDRNSSHCVSETYPSDLRKLEADAIALRRASSNGEEMEEASVTQPWDDNVTGLALSGGGVRSATIGLGVIQAMAKHGVLRRVDFLSTVSGGGYIGSFLGRIYDRLNSNPENKVIGDAISNGPRYVENELTRPDSKTVAWLRKYSNYISPTGVRDWRLGLAAFARNFVSVHFVIGCLLIALFGIFNAFRYVLLQRFTIGLELVLNDKGSLPLAELLEGVFGSFWSPWLFVFELVLWFLVVPRIVGYWLVSQEEHERYLFPSLSILFIVASLLAYLGVSAGLWLSPLVISFSLLSSFIQVELAWHRGKQRERAIGSGSPTTRRLRTRNYLTYDLGLAFVIAIAVLGFTIIDSIAYGLHAWIIKEHFGYQSAFATMGATLLALYPVVRLLSRQFETTAAGKSAFPPFVAQFFNRQILAGMFGFLIALVPLTIACFIAHAIYQIPPYGKYGGMGITLLLIVISFILARRSAVSFANRSSLSQLYAARLARTYLGASNPRRYRPEGENVTEVLADDDTNSIVDYRPFAAGGPLHLLNVIVNETIDSDSPTTRRFRDGQPMVVSSLGVSIGRRWHARWHKRSIRGASLDSKISLEPLHAIDGEPHPLLNELGSAPDQTESLSLRRWMAISGAAIGPGQGDSTSLGTSLLFGIANLRTGYWWDSGVKSFPKDGFPRLSFLQRFLKVIPEFFTTQFLLISEWIARYRGPWRRFWNLSDGGFFENLGAYELVRRRVPRIVVLDGGAEPTDTFESLAEFTRKVSIDFSASVRPFTDEEIKTHVPSSVLPFVGTVDQLRRQSKTETTTLAERHATLFWIDYLDPIEPPSLLLYIKSSLTGDESPDVQSYAKMNPTYPHESTQDQVFDEAQWESYRKLGEHMASPLFEDPEWFWKIERTLTTDQTNPSALPENDVEAEEGGVA